MVRFLVKKNETPGFPTDCNTFYIAMMISSSPLAIRDIEENFMQKFQVCVGDGDDIFVVSLESRVHSLCVIQNYGGNKRKYRNILPKRKVGQDFNRFMNSNSFS